MYKHLRKSIGIILLVLLCLGWVSSPVKNYISIPKNIVMFEGQYIPVSKGMQVLSNNNVSVYSTKQIHTIAKATHVGTSKMVMRIGKLPIKQTTVKVLKDIKLLASGHSIGVKLNTKGVLVVGHHLVETKDGKKSPGEIANIERGDIITKINGKDIEEMEDLTPFIQQAGVTGEALKLVIVRASEQFETVLKPLKGIKDEKYKIGLFIRDSAAGIGTLTFVDPVSLKYGALGHVISDEDTNKPIQVQDGVICKSFVTSIQRGASGVPGEKLARFAEDSNVLGNVSRNSPFGVFGEMNQDITTKLDGKLLPIALPHQVKEGPATILSVIDDEKVEEFDIEIVSIATQKVPATKGLVIKITDSRLLEQTGGIVQGMSGSPIIQNGRIIGAVTHVFVNDPTSGYGVHIEWMLKEAGIDIYRTSVEERKAG
ncbi:MAG: SpoIVB peptidase [Bacillaceae bacterium]